MIVLTGGAGFIGSCLLARLNELGIRDVLVVDRMTPAKRRNLKGKRYSAFVDKQAFLRQLRAGKAPKNVSALIHLGACTSTTETDADYLRE
ncbi:MAG: NAD-dependent epimerase/dehydratase family protein, partial [candidate division FCPU426 bacterium]